MPKKLICSLAKFGICWKTSEKFTDPKYKKIKKIPNAKPKSPTLFTTKALIAAALAEGLLYQKHINKYEQRPTPSHPKYNCKKLSDVTNVIIAKVNKDKSDINLVLCGS